MARHTACDRVNGVGDFHAVALEQFAEVGELALGLSLSQTEAGHEDDLLRVDELNGQIVRRGLLHGAFRTVASSSGVSTTAEATGQDGEQRAVHGLSHEDGQGHTCGTDECAGHDQGNVVNRQTGHGHSSTGACVEHGDHHWHISAADRNHEHQAVAQGEHGGQNRPQQALFGLDAQHNQRGDRQHGEQNVPYALARQVQLLDPLDTLQLAGSDERAGEGHRTDENTETSGDEHHDVRGAFLGQDVVQGHECGGATTHGIEHGDQLRHIGHLHLLGGDDTGHGTDQDADDQHHHGDNVHEALGEEHDERHEHGHDHAERGDLVTLAGGLRRIHEMQTDHKQDGREQVDEPSDDVDGANGCGGHYFDSPFFSFLLDLNISSMRSVTT